jgi:hypothetical protein
MRLKFFKRSAEKNYIRLDPESQAIQGFQINSPELALRYILLIYECQESSRYKHAVPGFSLLLYN